MRRLLFIVGIVLATSFLLEGQSKYFTRSGNISFFSKAPMENIEAHNKKATSVIDLASGRIEFALLIKAFQFEKALMQEHFNENYMESDKYPKAVFKGNIENIESVNINRDGRYPVEINGSLSLHNETNDINAKGEIIVANGQLSAKSSFEVLVVDYKIKIPRVVRDNIAKKVRVDVAVDYQQLKQKVQQAKF